MRGSLAALALLLIGVTAPAQSPASPGNSTVVKAGAERIEYNRMLFGQFIEHFDNQIYGGIFCPGNPLSDEDGFRTDVIQAMKELRVPLVRWPGGCFASTYHWRDGVGPDRAGFRLPDPRHHAFDADLSPIPEDRDPAFRADAGGRSFIQIQGQIVLRQLRRDPFACPAEGIRAGRGGE